MLLKVTIPSPRFQNKRARVKKCEQKKIQEIPSQCNAEHLLQLHNLKLNDQGKVILSGNERQSLPNLIIPSAQDSELDTYQDDVSSYMELSKDPHHVDPIISSVK